MKNIVEIRFAKLVLKALYIIMMTQGGFQMGTSFAKWNVEYKEFLNEEGE